MQKPKKEDAFCKIGNLQISVYRAVGKADNAKCRMQNAE
jgi:hypothetical protein